MALQQENDAGADRTGSITVETQVIHCGDTGVGCRFIFERENTHSRQSGEQADRSTLKKFLGRVTSFQEVRR